MVVHEHSYILVGFSDYLYTPSTAIRRTRTTAQGGVLCGDRIEEYEEYRDMPFDCGIDLSTTVRRTRTTAQGGVLCGDRLGGYEEYWFMPFDNGKPPFTKPTQTDWLLAHYIQVDSNIMPVWGPST